MTFAPVGSLLQTTTTSLSTSPANVGDLILVEVQTNSQTVWCTSISGGNAAWTPVGTAYSYNWNGGGTWGSATLFAGRATATGSATATLTFNGATPTIRCAGQEFSSTLGGWALDVLGNLGNLSGTNTMPSLTPAGPGELYFCFTNNLSSASAGSTSGYTYDVDAHGNGLVFNPSCTSSAQAPVWGDSGSYLGIAVLMREAPIVLQSAGNTAGHGTTISEQFASNVSSGSTLIAIAGSDSNLSGNILSVKDGASNSFFKIAEIAQGGTNGELSVWALNTPAGDVGTQATITATYNSAVNPSLLIQEVAGIVTSSTAAGFTDGTPGTLGGSAGGAGLIGPPTYSSTASNEYLLYAYSDDGYGNAVTAPAGYTLDPHSVIGTTSSNAAAAYKNSTGGTETGQWNEAGQNDWALALVAFKLAGAGPAGANVNGAVAAVSVAAPMGTVSVSTPGSVATVTVAAPMGTINVSTPGSVSAVTIAAPSGTESVSTAGSAGTVTVAALYGAVSVSTPGSAAAITVAAHDGTRSVSTPGSASSVIAAAPAGTPSVSTTGQVAAVAVAAFLGSIGVSVPGSAPPSVTVAAPAGSASSSTPATVSGATATVTVAAPMGTATGYAPGEQQVVVSIACSFKGYETVTATSATIEFKAGQPISPGLTTLASDPWFQMYPG